MKTTTLKFLIALSIPIAIYSCSSHPGNSNNSNDNTSSNADNGNNSNASVAGGGSLSSNNQGKDSDFVKEAAIGGLMEVELGKYAQKHAANPRVRNFGAMMVKDHTKVNNDLKAVAARNNITIPTSLDSKHQKMVSDMQTKSGADFDKKYMKEMVDDHEKDVDKFKKHAEEGTNSDLKAFASKALPTLLAHEDSAKNINDAIASNR